MIDCNKCIHLNMTEDEQIDKTKDHICTKYNIRVIHRAFSKQHHKFIYPCRKCVEDKHTSYVERRK